MKIDYKKHNRQIVVFKMLANANRLKIIKAILAAESQTLNVSEISKIIKLDSPKVSDHLKLLRINNILQAKQSGTMMFYSIKDSSVEAALKAI